MALDPPTMLTLSIALAAAAALYLAFEWRSIREPSLLFWSAGFATITLESTLALLRISGLLLIGIWFANGLLVVVHGSRSGHPDRSCRLASKRGGRDSIRLVHRTLASTEPQRAR